MSWLTSVKVKCFYIFKVTQKQHAVCSQAVQICVCWPVTWLALYANLWLIVLLWHLDVPPDGAVEGLEQWRMSVVQGFKLGRDFLLFLLIGVHVEFKGCIQNRWFIVLLITGLTQHSIQSYIISLWGFCSENCKQKTEVSRGGVYLE